jgi:hypothetical protein
LTTRLGSILYLVGLAGAAISIFYAVDAVWVFESGKSLLPISGRFLSLEEMLITIAIAIVLALMSWGAGVVARDFVNKFAEKRTGGKHRGGTKG